MSLRFIKSNCTRCNCCKWRLVVEHAAIQLASVIKTDTYESWRWRVESESNLLPLLLGTVIIHLSLSNHFQKMTHVRARVSYTETRALCMIFTCVSFAARGRKMSVASYILAAGGSFLVSRASRIFPTCTHARMTSGRGESERKNTSGHSRQVFVSQPGMLG